MPVDPALEAERRRLVQDFSERADRVRRGETDDLRTRANQAPPGEPAPPRPSLPEGPIQVHARPAGGTTFLASLDGAPSAVGDRFRTATEAYRTAAGIGALRERVLDLSI